MTGSQRTTPSSAALNVARIAFLGALVAGTGVGLAAAASASPCDPLTVSMTPQPVLSCLAPETAPPVDGAPAPVDVAAPPAPEVAPPVGEVPPPVFVYTGQTPTPSAEPTP